MLLSAIIEIIIICLLIGGAIIGYRKGLFRLAITPIRISVCFAFAFYLCRSVGDGLVFPMVFPAVDNYLKELLIKHIQSNTVDGLPTLLKIFIGLSVFEGDAEMEWTLDSLLEKIATPVSAFVSRVIAFIALFILAAFVLKLLVFFVDRLLDVRMLGRINAILGVLLSGFISAVLAWCFVSVVDYILLLDIFSVGELSGGTLFRFFREISPIRLLLGF